MYKQKKLHVVTKYMTAEELIERARRLLVSIEPKLPESDPIVQGIEFWLEDFYSWNRGDNYENIYPHNK